MNIAFHTFGCKLNQYETESLAEAFHTQGFNVFPATEEAALYIINTCTVTSKSEQKARRLVRNLARSYPESLLIVTGCYAQVDPGNLRNLSENMVVVSQVRKGVLHDFPVYLRENPQFERCTGKEKQRLFNLFLSTETENHSSPFEYQVKEFSFHSRAFLKIQDGCDYRCSYCRIPYARGSSRSLAPGRVLERIHAIEAKGYREIVLTGVNITAYFSDGYGLSRLLAAILKESDSVRIRLSSLEPDRIDGSLLQILDQKRICPHFHIPVQSGSDKILRAMSRRYSAAQAAEAVKALRDVRTEAFIAGDFIAGFPGEEEEDFRMTMGFIEKLHFSRLHVFPFSPRPDTKARCMKPMVPESVKKQRVRELLQLSELMFQEYASSWFGKTVQAVLERKVSPEGIAKGVSENYLKLVITDIPNEKNRMGTVISCRITETGNPCHARFLRFTA